MPNVTILKTLTVLTTENIEKSVSEFQQKYSGQLNAKMLPMVEDTLKLGDIP